MTYSDHAKEVLSKNSYKLTKSRLLIIDFFETSVSPVNAYGVMESISSYNKKVDVVSVYRTLALFKKLDLVHELSDGKFVSCQKFGCTDLSHCHHQFVCMSCHEIEELHINDKNFVSKLAKLFPKLSINSHHFTFEGLCEKCK